jgi:hypothetical protein
MEEKKPCPLCNTECEMNSSYSGDLSMQIFSLICPVCGKYDLSDIAMQNLDERKDDFYIISGITRNFYELHEKTNRFFVIKEEMIDDDAKFQAEFISKAPKSVLEKASLLLQYIARNSQHIGRPIKIEPHKDYPLCFCKDAEELEVYIEYLVERGFAKHSGSTATVFNLSLTIDGWTAFEKMITPNLESKQAFVAMWFDQQLDEPFEKGILPLEDKNETGFKMLRIDQKHFNDKICDHIIAEIKQSRFMIADCTELRPAVFFEAGYAMGLGLPVIFTCREGTDIKKCFDTDHYKHIVWKDADDLKNKLKDRILATIGKAH